MILQNITFYNPKIGAEIISVAQFFTTSNSDIICIIKYNMPMNILRIQGEYLFKY